MKRLLMVNFLILVVNFNINAQNFQALYKDYIFYYDDNLNQTDSINSFYYKKLKLNLDNNIPSGPISMFSIENILISKIYASYFEIKLGKKDSITKDGPCTQYYRNGKKANIKFFSKNIQIGEQLDYDQNGNLVSESTFNAGKLNGTQKTFYDTGEIKSTKNNVNDLAEGEEVGYYLSGEKKYVKNYLNGILNGTNISYYKNGIISNKRNYSLGLITGTEKGYDESGNLIYSKEYDLNNKLKQILFFYESGKIRQKVDYLNGIINGESIGYYETTNENYSDEDYSFENLAKQYSDDKGSSSRGGVMNPFASGDINSEIFVDTAFELNEIGTLSNPIQTEFGWHILKLISKKPVESYEKIKVDLEQKVQKDSRSENINTNEFKALVKEAYDRTANEVKAQHVLVRFESDQDSLAAYEKIRELRPRFVNEDFSSFRLSAHDGKSIFVEDLGYFSAFKMVYNFENAAFKTPVGQTSEPFKTQFGYHVVKVLNKRPSKGKVQVAHIMIANKQKDSTLIPENRIKELYNLLQQGSSNATDKIIRDSVQTKSYVIKYVDGIKEGIAETYFQSGKLKSTSFYKNGIKQGKEIKYRNHRGDEAKILLERNYDNGLLNDIETGYFENGLKKYVQTWNNGFLDGKKTIFYNSGKNDDIKATYNFKNGTKQGEFETFYKTGETETIGNFINGVKSDLITRYHKNKNLKLEEKYENGVKQGEWIEYYKSGRKKSKKSYEQNKLKGEFFEFDEINGEIISKVNYIDDEKHGIETIFYNSCEPRKETTFKNGIKDGEEIEYYQSGKIKSKKVYKDGSIQNGIIHRYYEISQRVKEKVVGFSTNKLTTGFYDSQNQEVSYIEKYNRTAKRHLKTEYYKSGNPKYEELVDEIKTTNQNSEDEIKFKTTEIDYYDEIKKLKSFERKYDDEKNENGYGYDKTGKRVYEVEYFQPQDIKDAEKKLEIKNKEIKNKYVKSRTDYYDSGNPSKIFTYDIFGTGTEIGYYDNDSKAKKWSVNHTKYLKNGIKKYYKSNGVDDYSEEFIEGKQLERKLALVIGNSNYLVQPFNVLNNPGNDARLLTKSLKKLGFTVMEAYDIEKRNDMFDVLDKFKKRSKDFEINMIYYAGHGISYDGKNYLIPTNELIETNDHLERNAFNIEQIKEGLDYSNKPNKKNILILDACRNNPLKKNRGGDQGGLEEIKDIPKGTVIAFSTMPGQVASDGDGTNSLYAKILSEKILTKNISISSVFNNIRLEFDKLGEKQKPIEMGQLTGDIYLNGVN